jgi:hypothetical protein
MWFRGGVQKQSTGFIDDETNSNAIGYFTMIIISVSIFLLRADDEGDNDLNQRQRIRLRND